MPEWTPRVVDLETDHEYDGIREYDNPLPRWWLLTFWGTILFSMGYWYHFHNQPETPGTYAAFQAEWGEAVPASEDAGLTDEALEEMAKDEGAVAAGKTHYDTYCMACHGTEGQGQLAPNLTDDYWIHGREPTAIHRVIADGVLEKGMAAWLPALGAKRVQEVTVYVMTMRGKNVAGKEPQGVDAAGKPPGS